MDNKIEICKKEFGVPCNCFQCRLTELVIWNSSTPLERRRMFKIIEGGKDKEEKETG